MGRRCRDELKIMCCTSDRDGMLLRIAGKTAVGDLHTLVVTRDGRERRCGIIEITEQDSTGSYIAELVWTDDPAIYKYREMNRYPLVTVRRSVSRDLLDRYMDSEGRGSTLAHVVSRDGQTVVVYRRLKHNNPWVCLLLDEGVGDFVVANETASLDSMKAWLGERYPRIKRTVERWGTEGARIYDVMEYGAVGDGRTDCSPVVERLLQIVRCGDVLYFPPPNRFYFSRPPTFPTGVVLDVKDEQIIVGSAAE